MKKMYVISVLTGLLLFISSCSKDLANNDSSKDAQILDKGTYSFLKSAKIYNEANQNRSEDYSASFDISKVERIGDTLNVTVSFLQGCEVSKFEVIWNGTIMESYPEMTILFVKRTTDNCGTQSDTISQVLSINLPEIIEDKALAQRINIIVSNASKKPNSDNADIPISNKN